jgi:tRNA nucleotidyltransferase (CCA-adding enzyme)
VAADPWMSIAEAARRRDFTINAMSVDLATGELEDPFGGSADLRHGLLRHTSERFAEDPLRVLRGMQLAARFDLDTTPETIELCRSIPFEGLAPERVFEEWRKLVLKGKRISRGLAFLRDTGWVRHFPELARLIDCPQDPQWHPEGDVWVHTLHVMDAFARARTGDDWEDLVVGFACLCHDLGKPATTTRESDGRIRSRGHEAAGEAPTRSFLAAMTRQTALTDEVVPLVRHHLKPRQLFDAQASDAAVRRLADKVGRIDRLARVSRADSEGRPPLPTDDRDADWLLERARRLELENQRPTPLVLGRHLIERGLVPGPVFGPILDRCFEAQLDGVFTDLEGGLAHLDRVLREGSTPVEAEIKAGPESS